MFANWQSDDRGKDEDKVKEHKNGLQLAHDLGQSRSDDGMAAHSAEENGVYVPIRRNPITVTGNDDNRQEHQGEAIYAGISRRNIRGPVKEHYSR